LRRAVARGHRPDDRGSLSGCHCHHRMIAPLPDAIHKSQKMYNSSWYLRD
jgi:hypothetical protein